MIVVVRECIVVSGSVLVPRMLLGGEGGVCQYLLLSTHPLDPGLWRGESDHPAFGLLAS